MTTAPICVTCGVQTAPGESLPDCGVQTAPGEPPPDCVICDDERQYLRPEGQRWTTGPAMAADGYRNDLHPIEPGLTGLVTRPSFAIGQRALLVATPDGNLLWDCVSLVDDDTVAGLQALGGVAVIATSHPHFHGAMVELALALGARVLVPEADAGWVQRPDPRVVRTWSDVKTVLPGVTLVQCGGHFDGSAVAHWAGGAGGRGALLVSDTAAVAADRRHVSFMRSYPNMIPLPGRTVREIAGRMLRLPFDRVYGAWPGRVIDTGGREAVRRSADRYLLWVRP